MRGLARNEHTCQRARDRLETGDEALGRTAAVGGDVHRYGFPRSDLQVTLDGVAIKPALALGGWVAFKPVHGEAMVMGDLVLLDTEINPVMAKLLANGIDITAVHNHLLRANPATYYMHVGGARRSGEARDSDPCRLGRKQDAACASGRGAGPPPAIDLDTAALDAIMGVKGQANGGVYQFAVPRRDPITEMGMALVPPGPTGMANGINFQPTGGGKAAITGDFVVTGNEVNPLVSAAGERHRGDGDPQPHAGRRAAHVLHPFLGER